MGSSGRFYELLAASPDTDPASLLREAQLWLRDLGPVEAQDVLDRYPELIQALRERRGSDPGVHLNEGSGVETEFSPYHWAGFVLVGA